MDTKTLYAKLNTVPPSILARLGSDEFVDYIEKLDTQFMLPEGSSLIISKLIQRLQIKDIGPEYFMGELASELNLEKNRALLIVEDIKKNIFSPIKDDLANYGIDISLLDKFQMPVIKKPVDDASPKVLQDIGPAFAAKPTSAGGPAPVSINKISATAQPTNAGPIAGAPNAGWSTGRTFATPKPAAPQVPPPVPITKPAAMMPPAAPRPSPSNPFGGKFEPMARTGQASFATTPGISAPASNAPTAPAAASGPAPFMLHEDTKPTSLQTSTDFRLTRPSEKGVVDMSSFRAQAPAKPAVLELGKNPAPNPPTFSPVTRNIPRYPAPENTGPRNVSEITAPAAMPAPKAMPAQGMPNIPKPPAPPKPPAYSMPIPKPPSADNTPKVIRQNY